MKDIMVVTAINKWMMNLIKKTTKKKRMTSNCFISLKVKTKISKETKIKSCNKMQEMKACKINNRCKIQLSKESSTRIRAFKADLHRVISKDSRGKLSKKTTIK